MITESSEENQESFKSSVDKDGIVSSKFKEIRICLTLKEKL